MQYETKGKFLSIRKTLYNLPFSKVLKMKAPSLSPNISAMRNNKPNTNSQTFL